MIEPNPGPRDRGAFYLLVAVLLAMPFACTPQARGQHAGHAEFHDVYRDWSVPGTTIPCCNAKTHPVTGELLGGDCYATVAEIRRDADGNLAWWARLDNGRWIEVPRAKIVNELNPDDTGTRAHICETITTRGGDGGVLCFLPPTGGS